MGTAALGHPGRAKLGDEMHRPQAGDSRPFPSPCLASHSPTSAKYSSLTEDDRLLLGPLNDREIAAEPAVWNDHTFPWRSCEAVVIRSCWDYHLKPDDFLGWIASLEATAVPIVNSSALIRWNANKTHLRANALSSRR